MEFKTVVWALAEVFQIDPQTMDTDAKTFEIKLQDDTLLTLEWFEKEGFCSLSGLLGFTPAPQNKAALYDVLLQSHAFGVLTQQSYFAINEEQSKVFMFRNFPLAQLDASIFQNGLLEFVEALRAWRSLYKSGELTQYIDPPPTTPAAYAMTI